LSTYGLIVSLISLLQIFTEHLKLLRNKLPSNLRPTTHECVQTVCGTDMTPEISRRHVYMPTLDDAMRSPHAQLYSCTHQSVWAG